MAPKMDLKEVKPLLTIVVPVHNMSGRLTNLSMWLDEARNLNVKVILVHDKSDDSTGRELFQLVRMKNQGNFSIIEAEVRSPGLARNLGLKEVDTIWFSFADADDIVNVSSLLKLLKDTNASGCDLGIGGYSSTDLRSGLSTLQTPPNSNEEAIALHLVQSMGLWRLIFFTKKFKDIRFTSHRMGEDFVFTNRVLNQVSQIKTSPDVVYRYFHGGDLNLTSDKAVMSEMLGVIEVIKSLDTSSKIGQAFKRFALQKLALSVLKNLPIQKAVIKKISLSMGLISHPIRLKKILRKARFEIVDHTHA